MQILMITLKWAVVLFYAALLLYVLRWLLFPDQVIPDLHISKRLKAWWQTRADDLGGLLVFVLVFALTWIGLIISCR